MAWTTMAAIYFIIWWLVFFAVLPWGVRSQSHDEILPGTDPGAPSAHGLKLKLAWTTGLAGLVFGLFYWAYVTKAVAFEDLATLWGLLKR